MEEVVEYRIAGSGVDGTIDAIESGGSKTGKTAQPGSLDGTNPSAWEIVFAFTSTRRLVTGMKTFTCHFPTAKLPGKGERI
ncbi:MAG TPA: hypothetical protein PLN56_10760 [Methanoregulaceae archaeon]|jgi:hypothetical protein|nr:hypothetical protein [Methanoregulaceae archaeon]HRU80743.1 hypothetical protein [Methanolinea sp.]